MERRVEFWDNVTPYFTWGPSSNDWWGSFHYRQYCHGLLLRWVRKHDIVGMWQMDVFLFLVFCHATGSRSPCRWNIHHWCPIVYIPMFDRLINHVLRFLFHHHHHHHHHCFLYSHCCVVVCPWHLGIESPMFAADCRGRFCSPSWKMPPVRGLGMACGGLGGFLVDRPCWRSSANLRGPFAVKVLMWKPWPIYGCLKWWLTTSYVSLS